MEPRPSERGNNSFTARYLYAAPGFNGATSFRTWKPCRHGGATAPCSELQWSHVLPNVETARSSARRLSPHALQWSHVLPNVETTASAVRTREPRASMEPRPSERGNIAMASMSLRASASMEPRPSERGNAPWDGPPYAGAELQWSHVLPNVETCRCSCAVARYR